RSGFSERSWRATISPAGPRAMTSVNVPPRSIQNCQRPRSQLRSFLLFIVAIRDRATLIAPPHRSLVPHLACDVLGLRHHAQHVLAGQHLQLTIAPAAADELSEQIGVAGYIR